MLADSLMLACKVIFSQHGLLMKIMSDVGGNFISDKFKQFCKNMNMEQAISSWYHHHSNGQVFCTESMCVYKIHKLYYEKMYGNQ